MWHRDLQQHVSLYHRDAGIVFGGEIPMWPIGFSTLLAGPSFLCDGAASRRLWAVTQTVECRNHGWTIEIESTASMKLQ